MTEQEEQTQPEGDNTPQDDAGRTYSADEMRQVREEAGTRRTQLRAAEAERDRYRDALRQLAVKDAVSGLLADPSDLVWSDDYADETGLPDREKISAAAQELLTTKPHLGRPSGDVQQGFRGDAGSVSLVEALRGL